MKRVKCHVVLMTSIPSGAGRGRINGIFQCYNKGEMSCYEEEKDDK